MSSSRSRTGWSTSSRSASTWRSGWRSSATRRSWPGASAPRRSTCAPLPLTSRAAAPRARRLVFLAHAYAKAFVFTFPGTVAFFEQNGFPGWTAYPVFAAELVGGAMLLLGLRMRLAALGLIPVMLEALRVHGSNGWMFTGSGGGWEYVAFLLVALGAQALAGDGALSLSRALGAGATRTAAPETAHA